MRTRAPSLCLHIFTFQVFRSSSSSVSERFGEGIINFHPTAFTSAPSQRYLLSCPSGDLDAFLRNCLVGMMGALQIALTLHGKTLIWCWLYRKYLDDPLWPSNSIEGAPNVYAYAHGTMNQTERGLVECDGKNQSLSLNISFTKWFVFVECYYIFASFWKCDSSSKCQKKPFEMNVHLTATISDKLISIIN